MNLLSIPTRADGADRPRVTGRRPGLPTLRVLIVEDDVEAARHLADDLMGFGIEVEVAHDGAEALEPGFVDGRFDVLILDRMLPGCDGLALLQALRARGVETPALFLTAMGAVADRVEGLEAGGDDYLVKPVDSVEMHARVQTLARRGRRGAEAAALVCADLELDRLSRTARRGGEAVSLLPLEYRLLEVLLLARGQAVTRKMLLEQVWGFRFDPRTNIVESHISRLRAKIDAGGRPPLIRTIRGAGYVLDAL
jgi:two-component system OmpR family response regulator